MHGKAFQPRPGNTDLGGMEHRDQRRILGKDRLNLIVDRLAPGGVEGLRALGQQ